LAWSCLTIRIPAKHGKKGARVGSFHVSTEGGLGLRAGLWRVQALCHDV
jgi:hypothetical protein